MQRQIQAVRAQSNATPLPSPDLLPAPTPAGTARLLWVFLRRDLRIWTYFRFNFLIDMADPASQLLIAAFVATLRGVHGYVDYVVLGVMANALLAAALAAPYGGFMDAFWNNRVETLLSSSVSLSLFVAGTSLGRYVRTGITLALYVLLGVGLLRFGILAGGLPLAVVVAVVAIAACTGLGLAAASMVYLVDARGGQDPIQLVVGILAGLASGAYFPLQTLPRWAQWLACLIPHTYALDAIHRLLLRPGGPALPPLPPAAALGWAPVPLDLTALAAYAAAALPLGWRLFERAIDIARRDGRLSRWV